MSLTIDTTLRELNADIAATLARMSPLTPFLVIWGQNTAKRARANARGKGGRRFWRELAASVQVRSVGRDAVSVHTAHVAAAQKQFCGDIRPKNARALTIPISDEARGKRASEFETGGRELFVLPSDKPETTGILGYSEGDDTFHALFVLRTRVHQDPEPWWPTTPQVAADGLREAKRFVQKALDAGGKA